MALRGETNLFTPCQVIGLYCSKGLFFFKFNFQFSEVPPSFTFLSSNKENSNGLIVCAIENQLCFYSSKNLCFASPCPPVDSEITCVVIDQQRTYAAFGFCVAIIRNRQYKVFILFKSLYKYF